MKPYCCYGMYADVGHDAGCPQAQGAASPAPAQPAQAQADVPPPMPPERVAELWVEHGLDECDPEGFATIIQRERDEQWQQRIRARSAQPAQEVARG